MGVIQWAGFWLWIIHIEEIMLPLIRTGITFQLHVNTSACPQAIDWDWMGCTRAHKLSQAPIDAARSALVPQKYVEVQMGPGAGPAWEISCGSRGTYALLAELAVGLQKGWQTTTGIASSFDRKIICSLANILSECGRGFSGLASNKMRLGGPWVKYDCYKISSHNIFFIYFSFSSLVLTLYSRPYFLESRLSNDFLGLGAPLMLMDIFHIPFPPCWPQQVKHWCLAHQHCLGYVWLEIIAYIHKTKITEWVGSSLVELENCSISQKITHSVRPHIKIPWLKFTETWSSLEQKGPD